MVIKPNLFMDFYTKKMSARNRLPEYEDFELYTAM